MTINKIRKKNIVFSRIKEGRKYIYHVMTPKGNVQMLSRTDFKDPLEWQEFDRSIKNDILTINDTAYILMNIRSKND